MWVEVSEQHTITQLKSFKTTQTVIRKAKGPQFIIPNHSKPRYTPFRLQIGDKAQLGIQPARAGFKDWCFFCHFASMIRFGLFASPPVNLFRLVIDV